MNYNFVGPTPGRPVRVGDFMRWRGYKPGERLGGPYKCVKIEGNNVFYGDEFGEQLIPGGPTTPPSINAREYYTVSGLTEYPLGTLEFHHACRKPIVIIL